MDHKFGAATGRESMTKESLASTLNGREYGEELLATEELAAKTNGLLVIFGASDDIVEMRGAIKDESYDSVLYISKDGSLLPSSIEPDEVETLRRHGVFEHAKIRREEAIRIAAMWCDENSGSGLLWRYCPIPRSLPLRAFTAFGKSYCRISSTRATPINCKKAVSPPPIFSSKRRSDLTSSAAIGLYNGARSWLRQKFQFPCDLNSFNIPSVVGFGPTLTTTTLSAGRLCIALMAVAMLLALSQSARAQPATTFCKSGIEYQSLPANVCWVTRPIANASDTVSSHSKTRWTIATALGESQPKSRWKRSCFLFLALGSIVIVRLISLGSALYAAISSRRSSASHAATKSDTSQRRSVTPAAIAGVVRRVE